MLREEKLKRMQLLRHTLDIIQPIHSNDQFDALKPLFQFRNTLLDLRLLDALNMRIFTPIRDVLFSSGSKASP
jgi:hypothetical protein